MLIQRKKKKKRRKPLQTHGMTAKLFNLDEEGYQKGKEDRRRGLVQEISQMHRCVDETNRKIVQMYTSQVGVR